MPSLTKTDAVEAKGKGYLLQLMHLFLWVVAGITLWGIGDFVWKMLAS